MVRELAQYPCKEVTRALAKIAVVDISYRVRRAAVTALKEINPEEALQNFVQNLNHQNPAVIINVLHAIGQVGYVNRNSAIQAVTQRLDSRNHQVRELATRIVQKLAGADHSRLRKPSQSRFEIVSSAPAFH